jgi:hypothetical protein
MSKPCSKADDAVCSFTFADGRRCRTPRCKNHAYLCHFHEQKEVKAAATQQITYNIGTWLTGDFVSAGDLAAALGQVIAFTAQGKINRKTATTVAYLSQSLLQAIKLSQNEYINAWGADNWRRVIRSGTQPPSVPPPAPNPDPAPAPTNESPTADTDAPPTPATTIK